METCQIHQTKIDQNSKLVAIAPMPIQDIGDERRTDGISFSVCGMCIPHYQAGAQHSQSPYERRLLGGDAI
jgi:hypothetical protein